MAYFGASRSEEENRLGEGIVIDEGVVEPTFDTTVPGPGPSRAEVRQLAGELLGSPTDDLVLSVKARKRAASTSTSKEAPSKKSRTSEIVHEPKHVTALDRIREFPGQSLTVSLGTPFAFNNLFHFIGELFCAACRKAISTKLSTLKDHISSPSHSRKMEERQRDELKQSDMVTYVEVPVLSHLFHLLNGLVAAGYPRSS